MQKRLISFLSELVTAERYNNFQQVLNNRTNYITVVLEDLFQSHNASAVLRSCECFGVQNVHFIENKFQFVENPDVAVGSSQWLTTNRYNQSENNTLEAIKKLKKEGYRIVATTPHKDDVSLEKLDLERGKIALIFGTELNGLSDLALENSDEYMKINMFGFTESFNISVSVALCLYELTLRLRKTNINWQLSESEKEMIMVDWLKKSIKDSENIIKYYFK